MCLILYDRFKYGQNIIKLTEENFIMHFGQLMLLATQDRLITDRGLRADRILLCLDAVVHLSE
jgi:hypothetical protein